MWKVLQERGFGSLPRSTKANPKDQVKSISTTIKADSYLIHHIRSSQYAVSIGQSRTLMYKTRQTMIPFPSHLNVYYYEEKKGSYGPQFLKAYSEASQSIPQKEKDPGSFTLPCFINNVCFDNSLVDLGASSRKSMITESGITEPPLGAPSEDNCLWKVNHWIYRDAGLKLELFNRSYRKQTEEQLRPVCKSSKFEFFTVWSQNIWLR
ncbi:hypothetical protein Tco_0152890 [Tanacetum coccineum]